MHDPLTQPYAPPQAPIQPASPPKAADPLGWILVALPIAGGVASSLLADVGAFFGFGCLVATMVIIGVDASRRGQPVAGHVIGAVLLWAIFFPLYMYRRSKWGAPNLVMLAIAGVVVYLAGSFYHPLAVETRAYVRCDMAGATKHEGFDCTIQHKQGSDEVQACWNVVLTCANGPGGSAHACGTVHPGQTEHVAVPWSAVQGGGGCDRLTKIVVEDLSLEVQ